MSDDSKMLDRVAEIIYDKLTSLDIEVYEIDCYEAALALSAARLLTDATR